MLAALVTYYLAGALAALYVAVAVRLARACSGRVASALLVFCAILSLAGAAAVVRHDGSYDFAAFHAGGALVGTQELYVDEALIRDETAVKGGFVHMPFFRLPSYGLLLKPLTWLPVPTARALWFAINAAALVGSIVLWPNLGVAARIVASACFFPVYYTLLIGQDSALFLFLAAVATRCLVVRRDVAGGLALSLCAIKFSLGVALPVVLLAHRRWAAIASAAFGVAVQLVLSLVVQGPSWPRQYVAAFRSPAADVADFMPNLRGLFHWLPYATGLEVAGGSRSSVSSIARHDGAESTWRSPAGSRPDSCSAITGTPTTRSSSCRSSRSGSATSAPDPGPPRSCRPSGSSSRDSFRSSSWSSPVT
jgi:hypothetical protein